MKNLGRGTTPSRRLHKRNCGRDIEAAVDVVGKRHVIEIDVVDDLRPLLSTLLLFLSANKVAVGALFAEADRELPSLLIEKASILRTGIFAASALHADHGRTLSCSHS